MGAGLGDILSGFGAAAGTLTNLIRDLPGGDREAQEALNVIRQVQEPNFDFSRLTPPQLRFVAAIDPVFFDAQVPEEVKVAVRSPIRDRQIRQLDFFERVADEGLPLEDRLAAESAADAVARERSRAQEAVLSNLAARGRLGGGQELQARLLAGQGQTELEAQLGRGLAQEALGRRFQGALTAAQLGGELAGAEEQLSQNQAETINRFNELAANLRQQAAFQNARAQQEANFINARERQRIEEANALLPFQTAIAERDQFNQLQQQLANFRAGQGLRESQALERAAAREDIRAGREEAAITRLGAGLGRGAGGIVGGIQSGGFGNLFGGGIGQAQSAVANQGFNIPPLLARPDDGGFNIPPLLARPQ